MCPSNIHLVYVAHGRVGRHAPRPLCEHTWELLECKVPLEATDCQVGVGVSDIIRPGRGRVGYGVIWACCSITAAVLASQVGDMRAQPSHARRPAQVLHAHVLELLGVLPTLQSRCRNNRVLLA